MKNVWKAMKISIAFCVIFAVGYIGMLWLFARVAGTGNGKAETVALNGKTVGAILIGQSFTEKYYFWGRPSAAGEGYDATRSSGSNKGPTNEGYLAEVSARIDTFLVHHPYLNRKEVPVEMVTSSGSGLDPDITPESAYVQVKRVAMARGLEEDSVRKVVAQCVEHPLLSVLGTGKVNVLQLNIALDRTLGNKK